MNSLNAIRGFDWDDGNSTKNWLKHRVTIAECEEVFLNGPSIDDDISHSDSEQRFHARGATDSGRRLFISFTIRNDLIRVISARPMDRQERRDYDQEAKENTEI